MQIKIGALLWAQQTDWPALRDAAIAADLTLDEALLAPARVAVEAGVFAYAESDFYGCAFRHTWMMDI